MNIIRLTSVSASLYSCIEPESGSPCKVTESESENKKGSKDMGFEVLGRSVWRVSEGEEARHERLGWTARHCKFFSRRIGKLWIELIQDN